jgi:hypothetical protein
VRSPRPGQRAHRKTTRAAPRPNGYPAADGYGLKLILTVGIVLEVLLVFGLGLPEGAGRADPGHDLAGPKACGIRSASVSSAASRCASLV